MSVRILVKVDGEPEFELEHRPETCTDDDIAAMCFAIRRYLREAYGRSPFQPRPQ